MVSDEQMRAELGAAMSGPGPALAVADRLCRACVALLEVGGASISLTLNGTNRGTFGSSGDLSRRLDALQFTFGEGPCPDAVRHGSPVLVADLDDSTEDRVEVYQPVRACDPTEALVRLRAYSYAHDMTAVEVARQIVERRLSLDSPDWQDPQWQDPAGPDRST